MSTILLVDNDPLQALLCKSILERRFSDVQRVNDAAEALCLVEQPHFVSGLGLVVSDLNMPGFGSAEFVAELHERFPEIPVLVLGNVQAAPACFGKWVKFVSRPFAAEKILAVAAELIAKRESEAA